MANCLSQSFIQQTSFYVFSLETSRRHADIDLVEGHRTKDIWCMDWIGLDGQRRECRLHVARTIKHNKNKYLVWS